MQQLSSSGTTFYKIIFPALWLAGFGFASVVLLQGGGTPPPSLGVRLLFPAIWCAGVGAFYWYCFPLKYVWLGPATVTVAGLFRKTEIPLADIERVGGTVFLNPETITLTLKRPSVFGSRIRFMPKMRGWPLNRHPTLTLLKERLAGERTQ